MISESHSAAARQNGAQSHGPVTDEGKARSSQNARKSGLFAQISFRNDAEKETYDNLLNAYLEEYSPGTLEEHRCVRDMVDAEWRLAQLRESMFQIECKVAPTSAEAFEKLANSGQTLSLALRYEKHFQSLYNKALQAFRDARRRSQQERKSADRRTDTNMASLLRTMMEFPLPGLKQNEHWPTIPTPQQATPFHAMKAPNGTTPNLFKG